MLDVQTAPQLQVVHDRQPECTEPPTRGRRYRECSCAGGARKTISWDEATRAQRLFLTDFAHTHGIDPDEVVSVTLDADHECATVRRIAGLPDVIVALQS